VSSAEIVGLGAIAGFTIYLGLPLGRLRNPAPRLQAMLNAVAIGILVFLLFDVLSHANEPVETALNHAHDGTGSWWRFAGLAAIFAVGVGIGLLTLGCHGRGRAP
jgi:ZIP family zinc transporter